MRFEQFLRKLSGFVPVFSMLPLVAGAATLELQQVAEDIYAIVGPLDNRSPENLGNNATFGFVVTTEGVVLIDPGGSHAGAAEIERTIMSVTDLPVKVVINTGGQDHRWLGNGYFKAKGAKILASAAAVADQQERGRDQFMALNETIGEQNLSGTEPVYADETFEDSHHFSLGGVEFELRLLGPAHTPGDSILWLPGEKVVFTGDIVYVERMLGVGPQSNSGHWIGAFEAIAKLGPVAVVPGHGHATTLETATTDTYDYLAFLRQAVTDFIDAGSGVEEIGNIDQSRFSYLQNFDSLKGRNAQQVFDELEWE
ncbi:MAG: MBL fold metallo-hydrolase [Pseudomonadota bacterium]|nr:MBL fold metallo-hydrolase [Pseudomonadota bacterium]